MSIVTHDEMVEYLREYLTMTSRMNKGRPSSARYAGISDFLLDLGGPMQGQPLPEDIERGVPQECFRNSHELVINQLDRGFTYFEGYAVRASLCVPILHAWCVDELGGVIDTTWKNSQECTYWGVGFDYDFMVQHTLELGWYGILGNHWMTKEVPLFNLGVVLDDEGHICNYNED